MRKIIATIFIFLPIFSFAMPEKPAGFVNDLAGVFSADQKNALEIKLSEFEQQTSNEIAVAIVSDLEGDAIEGYAVQLFEKWAIGKKGKDNGVLILAAIDERKMHIEVGYGLEGALTDAQSFWIINQVMKPAFAQGDYYQGIDGTTDKIMAATLGEYLPSEEGSGMNEDLFGFIAWMIFVIPIWLASILGRSKSWWLGGALGGVAGAIIAAIFGLLYIGVISLAVLIPLGLLFDYFVSKSYNIHKSSGRVPWWIGGPPRGGFGGGMGGFGGFGGGRSGGGGASGSW